MKDLTVTIIQSEPYWLKVNENLTYLDSLINDIKEPTDLILLPEMFNTGFVTSPSLLNDYHPSLTIEKMRQWAAEKNCVVAGTLIVTEGRDNFNRLIWMKPDGEYQYYDKRHLFRFANEHASFSTGNKELFVSLHGWKLKPLICYDLRFPVWCKNRCDNGEYAYDIIFFLSNWPTARRFTWKSLLPARAIENQSYCIGVNRSGADGNDILHSGESMVINQRGEHLALLAEGQPEIRTVTLNYNLLEYDRKRFAVGLDWDNFNIEY